MESKTEPILRTTELEKRFGGLTAVDHVNFSIDYGELHCLIGPNGAGKSTIFNLLTGQLSPTSGEIYFKNEDITNLDIHSRARRGISLKFQSPRIYQQMSVSKNILTPLLRGSKGSAERDERLDELLSMIGLQAERDAIAGDLSHGQQQWLEIAMAISIEPDMLLLDEPTAGMTMEETVETGNIITELNKSGITVVVVEHDIKFIHQIAESVTVLHQGDILFQGTPDEVSNNEEVQRVYLGQTAEGSPDKWDMED
jgi:branched-chain amino acid transport system ATP-binding protein